MTGQVLALPTWVEQDADTVEKSSRGENRSRTRRRLLGSKAVALMPYLPSAALGAQGATVVVRPGSEIISSREATGGTIPLWEYRNA
jgi:hypothetical protein